MDENMRIAYWVSSILFCFPSSPNSRARKPKHNSSVRNVETKHSHGLLIEWKRNTKQQQKQPHLLAEQKDNNNKIIENGNAF